VNPPLGEHPTVAKWLTPPGIGAVGVVQVSGPQAGSMVGRCFRLKGGRTWEPAGNRIVLGQLHDGTGVIDDALVVATGPGPEAPVEINTHGSWRVLQRLMTRLAELGAEVAGGKVARAACGRFEGDALWADLWETLAKCRTRRAVRWVTSASSALGGWLRGLPDQPPPEQAASLRAECEAMLERYRSSRVLVEGVRVVLLGPPNAGKSTLANRLYARQASLESPAPGTTRDWVDEPAVLGGVPIRLVDTAGLARPSGNLEQEAIGRGLDQGEQADFWWIVVEAGTGLPPETERWLAGRPSAPRTLVVINKVDLVPGGAPDRPSPDGLTADAVRVSALTGEGLDQLVGRFLSLLGLGREDESGPGLICPGQAEAVRFRLARWSTDNPADVVSGLQADFRGLPGIE